MSTHTETPASDDAPLRQTYMVWDIDDASSTGGVRKFSTVDHESAARLYAAREMARPSADLGAPASVIVLGVARLDTVDAVERFTVHMSLTSVRI